MGCMTARKPYYAHTEFLSAVDLCKKKALAHTVHHHHTAVSDICELNLITKTSTFVFLEHVFYICLAILVLDLILNRISVCVKQCCYQYKNCSDLQSSKCNIKPVWKHNHEYKVQSQQFKMWSTAAIMTLHVRLPLVKYWIQNCALSISL